MTTTTPQRIGGWLLGPLAWLLVALLSTTLALLLYRYRHVVLHTVVDHRFL